MILDHRFGRLRFRDLEFLVTLARAGSLRRAAQELGVSQPALSKILREIEDGFGVALYERGSGGLVATAAGTRLISAAQVMLAELTNARTAARADLDPPLRVGATSVVALVLLPRWLKALGTPPTIITEGAVPGLLDGLDRGELDAVVTMYPLPNQPPGPFSHLHLFHDDLLVVSGHGQVVPDTWAGLAGCDWVLPRPPSLIGGAIETCFRAEGLVPPVPKVMSVHPATNMMLVADGLGIGAMLRSLYEGMGMAARLQEIPVDPRPEVPPVCLVYRKAQDGQPRMLALIAAMKRVMAGAGAPLPPVRPDAGSTAVR